MLHETSVRASGDVQDTIFFFFLPKTGTAMAVPAVVAPTALDWDVVGALQSCMVEYKYGITISRKYEWLCNQ